MKQHEHLLVCLAEECAEVSHAVSKVLRFGLDDHHPDAGMENEDHLRVEFNDLLAVAELLEEEGVISFHGSQIDRERKKEKVRHYMRYARERRTLERSESSQPHRAPLAPDQPTEGKEMKTRDPFLDPGKSYGAVDATSRIDKVRGFDRAQCLAALDVPGLQKTVEKAIHVRLRKLERES